MPRERETPTTPPEQGAPTPAPPASTPASPATPPPRDAQGDEASDERLGDESDYVIIGGEPP
jgi:hypothetical protein